MQHSNADKARCLAHLRKALGEKNYGNLRQRLFDEIPLSEPTLETIKTVLSPPRDHDFVDFVGSSTLVVMPPPDLWAPIGVIPKTQLYF